MFLFVFVLAFGSLVGWFVVLLQAETRWDRFAKEKGITGSKRSRMMWDDDLKEWRPRHGYKRANDGVLNHAIVEVKAVRREIKKERT